MSLLGECKYSYYIRESHPLSSKYKYLAWYPKEQNITFQKMKLCHQKIFFEQSVQMPSNCGITGVAI